MVAGYCEVENTSQIPIHCSCEFPVTCFFSYGLIWPQLHASLHAACYEYLFLLTSASIPVGIKKEWLWSRAYSENNDSFNF